MCRLQARPRPCPIQDGPQAETGRAQQVPWPAYQEASRPCQMRVRSDHLKGETQTQETQGGMAEPAPRMETKLTGRGVDSSNNCTEVTPGGDPQGTTTLYILELT